MRVGFFFLQRYLRAAKHQWFDTPVQVCRQSCSVYLPARLGFQLRAQHLLCHMENTSFIKGLQTKAAEVEKMFLQLL